MGRHFGQDVPQTAGQSWGFLLPLFSRRQSTVHDRTSPDAAPRAESLEAVVAAGQFPLQRLLDNLPAAAYICDSEGLIVYFNRHAEQLWGRAPKLNDRADRYCGSFKLYSADGKPIRHESCWMALVLANGREYNGEEIIVERPDGSRLTVLAHANPIRDAAGRVAGAVNVLVDVTDRNKGDEVRAMLASIVESSDDAIISKTLDGRILTWNAGAQRLFGYTADEAVGAPITIIIPRDRHEEERSILERLRRGERIDHYETVRVSKFGRRMDISLTISPLRDRAGRIIGASKIARDITARKEADACLLTLTETLRQADTRKDEFLATLAHELRNPLAPLGNSLELLRLSGGLSAEAEALRAVAERQFKQMVRLVDDLLEVSRITRGKVELQKESVELAAVVSSAIETSRPLIDAGRHQLTVALAPEPMRLEADAVRLAQVVTNLLNNAARYTEPGGQIWLAARRERDEAVISVRDTGIGIPRDKLGAVFDMFAQIGNEACHTRSGLGIGLALARSFVALHGGRLEAHSAGPGHGSEFIVRLPLARGAERCGNGMPSSPRGDRALLPVRKILIVDDTQAAVHMLAKLLEFLGQEVRVAHDGAAALEIVAEEEPDVVISDIGMPEMDGYELASSLRRLPLKQRPVLVALSGYGQQKDRTRAREAGFDEHLVKPVGIEALHALLAQLPAPSLRPGVGDLAASATQTLPS
jgi:PAS domain S-box-containing protein